MGIKGVGPNAGENRLHYNTSEKSFEPMKGEDTGKLLRMEKKIDQLKVPPYRTSHTYLKKEVAPPNESKGTLIKGNTKGIKEFFDGNESELPAFLLSIKTAQRSL